MELTSWRGAVALAMASGITLAGCGSEEVFTSALAANEHLIEEAAAARLDVSPGAIQQVTAAGDLDGDGIGDAIVVSAYSNDDFDIKSRVHILYGGAGVEGIIDVSGLPELTDMVGFPTPVAPVGDLDGDGLADLVVQSGHVFSPANPQGVGILYGSAVRRVGTVPVAEATTLVRDASRGQSVEHQTSLGDIDGDGYADFAVGAQHSDTNVISLFVFYGRPTKLAGVLDLETTADAVIQLPRTLLPWDVAFATPLGDIDGDERADFLLVSTDAGFQLHVVYGGARLSGVLTLAKVTGSVINGASACDRMASVLGDLDGDGADELAVETCARERPFASTLHVFYGRTQRFPAAFTIDDADASIGNSNQVVAADVDGDGVSDLISADRDAREGNGAVRILPGTGTRLAGAISPASFAAAYVGEPQLSSDCDEEKPPCRVPASVGATVSIADLTGDHRPDIIVFSQPDRGVPHMLDPDRVNHGYVLPIPAKNP